MGRFISTYIPKPMQKPALWAVNKSAYLMKKGLYFGFAHYCPVCQSCLRTFKPLIEKNYSRRSAKRCPVCKSLERHRWVWYYLKEKTNLFDNRPKKVLHIAPETAFSRFFEKAPSIDYLSGDLAPDRAMEQMDITDIRYPDQTFDVIYCSHVLEHVPEDTKAISEFYRVLKSGSWALILVPIVADKTYEDVSITDPQRRYEVFGHPDHVRNCGLDYADRLRSAGFHVTVEIPSGCFNEKQMHRYGLIKEPLFFCEKNKVASISPLLTNTLCCQGRF